MIKSMIYQMINIFSVFNLSQSLTPHPLSTCMLNTHTHTLVWMLNVEKSQIE